MPVRVPCSDQCICNWKKNTNILNNNTNELKSTFWAPLIELSLLPGACESPDSLALSSTAFLEPKCPRAWAPLPTTDHQLAAVRPDSQAIQNYSVLPPQFSRGSLMKLGPSGQRRSSASGQDLIACLLVFQESCISFSFLREYEWLS